MARTSTVEMAGVHPRPECEPQKELQRGGCASAVLADDIGGPVTSDGVAPRHPAVEVPTHDEVAEFLREMVRWAPLETSGEVRPGGEWAETSSLEKNQAVNSRSKRARRSSEGRQRCNGRVADRGGVVRWLRQMTDKTDDVPVGRP